MRDPSQYDRDTFNLERIEVLRGSASMIFGRGSTGGVINQVTKKPLLADQSDVVGTVGTRRLLPRHRRLQHAHRRRLGVPPERHVEQGRQRRRQDRQVRHCAVVQLGHRHARRVQRRPVPPRRRQRAAVGDPLAAERPQRHHRLQRRRRADHRRVQLHREHPARQLLRHHGRQGAGQGRLCATARGCIASTTAANCARRCARAPSSAQQETSVAGFGTTFGQPTTCGQPQRLHRADARRAHAAQGRIQRHLRAERLQQGVQLGQHQAPVAGRHRRLEGEGRPLPEQRLHLQQQRARLGPGHAARPPSWARPTTVPA